MFGVGSQELLLILLVVLLLFGGKRIPEVARSLGKGMADIRRAMREVQREVDLEMLKTPESDRRGPASGTVPPPPCEPPAAQTPASGQEQAAPGRESGEGATGTSGAGPGAALPGTRDAAPGGAGDANRRG